MSGSTVVQNGSEVSYREYLHGYNFSLQTVVAVPADAEPEPPSQETRVGETEGISVLKSFRGGSTEASQNPQQ